MLGLERSRVWTNAQSYRALSTLVRSRIQRVQESFFKPVHRVVINVPATSANLGPGFDSFGFALDVWNRIIVERADSFSMTITGEGADRIECSANNMIARAAARALESLDQEMPPLRFECQNAIPPTRGMGSSSAALVGGLAAGLAMGGKDLSSPATKKLLLQLAAEEEGHADNVAPAIYGGFQIAFRAEDQWITQRVSLPNGLQCVLFIPDDEMSTKEARAVLPPSLPYEDAVFNISRAAMLVNCFATAQFDPLRYAMQDRLHQQYRSSMFPFDPFIKTALEAGAHGAFLSGAGPTVLAIAGGVGIADPGSDTMSQFLAEAVSEAMLTEARNQSIPATVHISAPSALGVSSVGTAADGSILWHNEQSRDATAAATP